MITESSPPVSLQKSCLQGTDTGSLVPVDRTLFVEKERWVWSGSSCDVNRMIWVCLSQLKPLLEGTSWGTIWFLDIPPNPRKQPMFSVALDTVREPISLCRVSPSRGLWVSLHAHLPQTEVSGSPGSATFWSPSDDPGSRESSLPLCKNPA